MSMCQNLQHLLFTVVYCKIKRMVNIYCLMCFNRLIHCVYICLFICLSVHLSYLNALYCLNRWHTCLPWNTLVDFMLTTWPDLDPHVRSTMRERKIYVKVLPYSQFVKKNVYNSQIFFIDFFLSILIYCQSIDVELIELIKHEITLFVSEKYDVEHIHHCQRIRLRLDKYLY